MSGGKTRKKSFEGSSPSAVSSTNDADKQSNKAAKASADVAI
jgi:hypothetical protein